MNAWHMVAILVALIVALAAIILYKKRIIDKDIIDGTATILEGISIDPDGSVFDMILYYAKSAVLTVQQLVKTGKIDRDDDARKEAAMKIVLNAAALDGIEINDAVKEAASDCIEAEVNKLPHDGD